MTRLFVLLTVLAIHTGAAFAQQAPADQTGLTDPGPLAWGPGTPPPQTGTPGPAAPAPSSPPPAAAPAPPPPAQPAPPSAGSDAYPPGYGPPPGYSPPPRYGAPPQYGYGPPPSYGPPQGYGPYGGNHYRYMPPPRRVTDRPFTLGGGIGFGGLKFIDAAGNTDSQGGFAYTARLGFGLAPGLLLLWDIEGATVNRGALAFNQTAQLAALQIFVGDRVFIKGGFGLARAANDYVATNWGGALMAGLGVEILQGWNWSLDVESTVTGARYDDETWINWSLVNFAINFF